MRSFDKLAAAVFVLALLAPASAEAAVKREGQWPATDPKVSIDIDDAPRAEGIKKLADAAGWSIITSGNDSDSTTIHVKDQPASRVLEILLGEGEFVAKREANLIVVKRVGQPNDAPSVALVPPIPPVPPIAPVPAVSVSIHAGDDDADDDDDDAKEEAQNGPDRSITGGNLRIEKNETVHDVTVMGGNVDIYGKVTGDVSVMGGNAHLHGGSHVSGDAEAVGGSLVLDDGAHVDGDVGVVGGLLTKSKGAFVGGDVDEDAKDDAKSDAKAAKESAKEAAKERHDEQAQGHAEREHERADRARERAERHRDGHRDSADKPLSRRIGDAITSSALFFVFGTVLLALATSRMERLKVEIASRPMRTFATGILGLLASVAVLFALAITIIGIPFAILGVLLGVFAIGAGTVGVFETTGSAFLGHKTKNPYVHLACGCLFYLVVGSIPWIGGFVWAFVVFTAIGSVVATRAAGLVRNNNEPSGSPYRDAPMTT